MVVGMEFGFLNGHDKFLFERLFEKEKWALKRSRF